MLCKYHTTFQKSQQLLFVIFSFLSYFYLSIIGNTWFMLQTWNGVLVKVRCNEIIETKFLCCFVLFKSSLYNISTTRNTSFTRDAFQLLQFLCMQQVTAAVCVLSQWPPAVSGGQNTAVISAHTAVSLHHTTGQGTDCSQCSQLQLSLLSRAAA